MKTQCSHCRIIFNVDEKYRGKKVRCPNCNQSFVITALPDEKNTTKCTKCGRAIQSVQASHIVQGKHLCQQCYEQQREEPKQPTEKPETTTCESPAAWASAPSRSYQVAEEESGWLSFHEANKIGIVAAILILLPGIYFSFLRETPVPFSNALWWKMGKMVIWLAVSLCLLGRSFRPRLGVWRGVLTVLGAFVVVPSVAGLVTNFGDFRSRFAVGFRYNPFGTICGIALVLAFGAWCLKCGFRPKQGLAWWRSTTNLLSVAVGLAVATLVIAMFRLTWVESKAVSAALPARSEKGASETKVEATQSRLNFLCYAVIMFRMDTGRYPTEKGGLLELVNKPADVAERKWYTISIEALNDAWGNEFHYKYTPNKRRMFVIISYGADGIEGGEGSNADLNCWDIR